MKRLLPFVAIAALLFAVPRAEAAGFDLNPQVVAAYAFSADAPNGVTASRFALTANLPGVRLGDEGLLSKLYVGGVGIDIRTVPGYEDLPADFLGWSIPALTYYFGDSNALAQVGYLQDIGQGGEKHIYAGVGFSVQTTQALAVKRAKKKQAREDRERAKLNASLVKE